MKFVLTYSSPVMQEQKWFEQQLKAWESRELLVNAQGYSDALLRLKAEVHR